MDMTSIMAGNLRSLQSTVQLSVLSKSITMNTVTAVDMLKSLPDQSAPHPHKGASVDVKA
ncbi:YjfB family protein [Filibacter tadaridae]|uniref:Motility protein n=1 Tax=Filibacter tadaridae TaxID=2483811 RepID=A0A3P5XAP4_9BACL|nr:YjfB family protein [Filibacter tadaridae]VDC25537.1 hypothetical protein FILTAD_01243 [Filibacter tadaridae]